MADIPGICMFPCQEHGTQCAQLYGDLWALQPHEVRLFDCLAVKIRERASNEANKKGLKDKSAKKSTF